MLLQKLQQKQLQWYPEVGIGYFPVTESPYDAAYFLKYAKMAETEMGKAIREFRLSFVEKRISLSKDKTDLVDIGIGSGDFVSHANCYGFDINPFGKDWLIKQGRFKDPYKEKVASLTFWDSLEHIKDIECLLANVTSFVFVSLPIFTDCAHILRSKHFRKDEHCWYFTKNGFVSFMEGLGFACIEISDQETKLGREDIASFCFRRFTTPK